MSQVERSTFVDGICMFDTYSAESFGFVKTEEWGITGDRLVNILGSKVSYYFSEPYSGFINSSLFVDGYLDTFSYGYNNNNDKRITIIYYCNCKLISSSLPFDEKKLELRYDKIPKTRHKFNYLYKGNPIRFKVEGLFYPPLDSVILYRQKQ